MKIEINQRFGPVFKNIDHEVFENLRKNQQTSPSRVLQSISEAFVLSLASYNSCTSDGDIIEIGCAYGGSAEIILNHKPNNKKFFVCDTFEGLKDISEAEDGSSKLKNGDISISLEAFSSTVKSHPDVIIKKGYFPDDLINDFENQKFSLAHLDVDTYESTLKSLNFLHNKMSKNSLIIVHDYNAHLPGVTKAVDKFCPEKNIQNYCIKGYVNCQTIIYYA